MAVYGMEPGALFQFFLGGDGDVQQHGSQVVQENSAVECLQR